MNKFTKRIAAVAGVSALALTLAACSNDKTVASYKGGKITESQLYTDMKKSQAGQSAFQNMLIQDVLKSQYGDKVSDKKVNAEFNKYKKQYGTAFDSILQQNGLTQSTFKKNIRTNMLTEVALKDIKKISKSQEEKAWKTYQPKITVQHILVKDEATAKEVISKLDAGENFKDLAAKYSTDKANSDDAGKLPAFDNTDTSLDSTFKTEAFKLKQGEYTKTPVKTQFGYHVIKNIKAPAKGKFKDHKKEIDNQLYQSMLQDQSIMQEVIGKVLKKADVDIKDSDLKNVLSQYAAVSSKTSEKPKTSSKSK